MSNDVLVETEWAEEHTGDTAARRARDLFLLTHTQAYLEIRSVGGFPDAVLVAA